MIGNTEIAVLILAAGESTRMGEPKQLLPWKETTLLGQAIAASKSVCGENVYVVLGASFDKISTSEGIENSSIIYNPNYKLGQGTSLSAGIKYLNDNEKQFKGILVLLCDQPLITSDYLKRLLIAFEESEKGIIATKYNNRAGVPAIFHSKYFEVLKKITGDKGAKEVINKNNDDMILFDAHGKELDLDTKEEYERLLNQLKS